MRCVRMTEHSRRGGPNVGSRADDQEGESEAELMLFVTKISTGEARQRKEG